MHCRFGPIPPDQVKEGLVDPMSRMIPLASSPFAPVSLKSFRRRSRDLDPAEENPNRLEREKTGDEFLLYNGGNEALLGKEVHDAVDLLPQGEPIPSLLVVLMRGHSGVPH